MERPHPDRTVDATGTFCPVPIIETAKVARELAPGQVILVLATDPGIESDVPVWCKGTGNEHLGTEAEDGVWRSWIRIGGPRAGRS
ncbi:MAG TPA: sulfurtransferase TusA family protein [Vulgatibacter sp.]|nr:sulfurtransferase TusA family protein [Vulgatibacter sp.]